MDENRVGMAVVPFCFEALLGFLLSRSGYNFLVDWNCRVNKNSFLYSFQSNWRAVYKVHKASFTDDTDP